LYKNPPFLKENIWFHACSLGEVRALSPLFEKFEEKNISVITQTGYEEALKHSKSVRFLPYEIFLPFWVKPCKKLVVMEAELWYMLFYTAKKRGCKTILLNARISDKSYPKYLKFKWFYKEVFKHIDLVLAQSEKDKERLSELGAKKIEVVGNIKTLFTPKITTEYKKSSPLIVVASTHKGEEEEILKNLPKGYQVVVAPRHPERFDEAYEIMRKFGEVKKISDKCKVKSEKCDLDGDLILMDKIGELVNLYAIADVVVLGGSFVDNVGGHNPIEAAYFNVPIISGRYIFNQKALYSEVDGIEICEADKLKETINKAKPTKIKNKANVDYIIKRIKSV